MDYTNPTYRTRTAFHEAAHAVVAELCSAHPRVDQVLIHSTDGGGLCRFARVEQAMAEHRDDLEPFIMQTIAVSLAGIITEELAFGGIDRQLDFETARRDEANAISLAFHLRSALMRERKLHGREADRQVRERFRAAAALAELHIRASWGAIERVAQALLECGSIPGELVRTVMDVAPHKQRSLERNHFLNLLRQAELADPGLRGSHDRVRDKFADADCEQLLVVLRALESWQPERRPIRSHHALGLPR